MSDPIIYLANLDLLTPVGTSEVQKGDNELREIKLSLKSTFPNLTNVIPSAVSSTYLNNLDKSLVPNFIGTSNVLNTMTIVNNNIGFNYLSISALNASAGVSITDRKLLDASYLGTTQDGFFTRLPPMSPLGSIIISELTVEEIELQYPSIYMLCDGKPMPTTSLLYHIMGGSMVNVPNMVTNNLTIRSTGSDREGTNNLNKILSAGRIGWPDGFSINFDWQSHNHASNHQHAISEYYQNYRAGGTIYGLGSCLRFFAELAQSQWDAVSTDPIDGGGNDIVMQTHAHSHTIFNTSDTETRSYEIRKNHFIRIN